MIDKFCPPCPDCLDSRGVHKKGVDKCVDGPVQTYLCVPCNRRFNDRTAGQVKVQKFHNRIRKSNVYIITSAQNATGINEDFWYSLLNYKEYNDAELIVIPMRYKNPTSVWTDSQENQEWWVGEVQEYLHDYNFEIHPKCVVMGEIKIQPTAVRPLSGLQSVSGDRTGIFGHPKVQLETVPVPVGGFPKIITTTGCVTKKNYTDSKAGKKAEFNHVFGATIVEVDKKGKYFHMRQVIADKLGSFIDLDTLYTPDEVKPAPRALGLVMGDTHAQCVEESVLRATFEGENSLVGRTNPEVLVWHDVLDFISANHHHRNDPFFLAAKNKAGIDRIADELETTFNLVNKYGKGRRNVFPASNHNEALHRWLRETDWRKERDYYNIEVYLETALYMIKNMETDVTPFHIPDPFVYWAKKLLDKDLDAVLLGRREDFSIANISVGQHGDIGSGGSRGSLLAYSKLGNKSIIGHTHAPGIIDGAYQVGTNSKLQLDYNIGPSRWLHTDCLILANGKRQLIHFIYGNFTSG